MPQDEWQIAEDARTLVQAEHIRNDPDRMAKVNEYSKTLLEHQKKDAQVIQGNVKKGSNKTNKTTKIGIPKGYNIRSV